MASIGALSVAVADGEVAIFGWVRMTGATEMSWTTVSGSAPTVGQFTSATAAGKSGSGYLTGNGVYRPGGIDPNGFWCIVCELGMVWYGA